MLDLHQVELAIQRAHQSGLTDEHRLLLYLRREFPHEIASQAVMQVRLRRSAKRKFSRAEAMWFTPHGLEQSSSEVTAAYHALRFPRDVLVVDAGCGIGGDLVALAKRGPTMGVDVDGLSLRFARLNLAAYEVVHNAALVHTDLLRLRLEQASFLFLDPARRTEGKRSPVPEQWSPGWRVVCELAGQVGGALIKTTPALPSEWLPSGCERDYISVDGQCRELLLAFGQCQRGTSLSATILPSGAQLVATGAPSPSVGAPLEWVYDPDPAVVAAHLLPELAQQLDARLLHPQIAYLTSKHLVHTPFARAYRVLEYFPYSRKVLYARLRALGAGPIVVKKRGVAQSPEAVVQEWKPVGERRVTVILYRCDHGVMCLLAETVAFQ